MKCLQVQLNEMVRKAESEMATAIGEERRQHDERLHQGGRAYEAMRADAEATIRELRQQVADLTRQSEADTLRMPMPLNGLLA